MKTIEQIETYFRQWVQRELQEMLGDEPNNVKYGIFPVKQFKPFQIITEETHKYISQKHFKEANKSIGEPRQKWPPIRQATADILGISTRGVSKLLKNEVLARAR